MQPKNLIRTVQLICQFRTKVLENL